MAPAPYQILGLTPRSTKAELRQRYKQLALLFHPDKNGGKNHELWVKYQLAYESMMKTTYTTFAGPSSGNTAEDPFDAQHYTSSYPEARKRPGRSAADLAKARARAEKEKERQAKSRQYEQQKEQERVRKQGQKWKAQQAQNNRARKASDAFYERDESDFDDSEDIYSESPPLPEEPKKAAPTPSTYSYGNPQATGPGQAWGGAEWEY